MQFEQAECILPRIYTVAVFNSGKLTSHAGRKRYMTKIPENHTCIDLRLAGTSYLDVRSYIPHRLNFPQEQRDRERGRKTQTRKEREKERYRERERKREKEREIER